MPDSAIIQASWIGAHDVLFLRCDNILGNEETVLRPIMDYSQIDGARERLQDIVRYNICEAATRKARRRGLLTHLGKGVVGDWHNHFTERVKTEFKNQYGALLIDTGYGNDLNW